MEACMRVLTALLLAFCMSVASASIPAAPVSSSSPSRSLLGSQLGYVPSGCPLTVSVTAEEPDPSWFQDAPEIRGVVTLSNPTSYNVPINNIIVQARSSNGLQYSTLVYCNGNGSPVVPYNPVPYTYGTLTCRYRLVLDRNVFGSYGQSGSRKLLGSGSVQANFFPGSSSGSSSGSGSGGYEYFPPPSQRPTWTVTAIVTVQYSNAQCLSAPTPVNTDCWWSWLSSWAQKHHHNWSWLFGSGRKLLMRLAGGETVLVRQTQQTGGDSSSVTRALLNSYSEGSSGDSGSEHREHRHHHHNHHHMHTGSSGSGGYSSGGYSSGSDNSGRSLLSTQDSGSEHKEHRHHHNHRYHMHTGSGSYSSGSDSGRSLLHSEGSSNSGSEGSEHRHRHHHHMSSEHNSGSYGSDSSSGRSLLNTHVHVLRDGHGVVRGGVRTPSGLQVSQSGVIPAGQTVSDIDDTVDDIEQQADDISHADKDAGSDSE